jgi:hypothetical protein
MTMLPNMHNSLVMTANTQIVICPESQIEDTEDNEG